MVVMEWMFLDFRREGSGDGDNLSSLYKGTIVPMLTTDSGLSD